MASETHTGGYRLYWITWCFLLAMTVGMLLLGAVSWPQWALAGVLLAAMLVKAGVIAGYFMHLRFEKPVLILIVAASILLTGTILFVLLALDALRVHDLSLP